MPGNRRKKPSKALRIGGICAAVFAAVAVGIGVWLNGKAAPTRQLESGAPKEVVASIAPQDAPAEKRFPIPDRTGQSVLEPDKAPGTAPQQPVVDYGRLKEDKSLEALMDKRKETYGFEKGVDLIVKPDESVKVGDEVVPMKEILDKIRLKSGEFIEKDLAPDSEEKAARKFQQELVSELEAVEKRYHELGKWIENPDPQTDPKTRETYLKQQEALGKTISTYKIYKEAERRIEEKRRMLQSIDIPEDKSEISEAKTLAPISAARAPGLEPGSGVQLPVGTPKAPAAIGAARPGSEAASSSAAASKPSADKAGALLPGHEIQAGKEPEAMVESRPAETPPSMRMVPSPPSREISVEGKRAPDPAGERHVTITELRKEIEREINTLQLQKGDIENELKILLKKEKRPEAYGIYVVQRGDDIWNIHFKFLKDYFDHRGSGLPARSDQPDTRGRSSGVGKILKFSEKMVYIYNIRERELSSDIHLIHPLSKIVVFNMGKVFELLEDVDYSDMDQIRFDGENIWLPARS